VDATPPPGGRPCVRQYNRRSPFACTSVRPRRVPASAAAWPAGGRSSPRPSP